MNGNEFNSNISPLEMAEMNSYDAKQFDVALGVIINEIPGKVASIKILLDQVQTKINTLETVNLSFDINEDIENLAKNYDNFSQNVINYASYYELDIIKVINIFDSQNSLDGSVTVDNNFLKKLPFLGTILFTLLSYYGNGNMMDDFPQLALDTVGAYMDRDFNAAIGNLIYNGVEYIAELKKWNGAIANGVSAIGLIFVESLYDILFVNTDSRQDKITLVNAAGDGIKLIAGNMVATYVAIPVSTAVSTYVAGLSGTAIIGAAAGGAVGVGIVVVGGISIEYVIEPIIDEITGEAFIDTTSIPKNGGLNSLYSDYVKSIDNNISFGYGIMGRTTSLYGMNVSAEYCQEMVQLQPVETLLALDDYGYVETSYPTKLLKQYIADLESIPNDSPNFNEQVEQLTANAMAGDGTGYGTEYIVDLINSFDFDPYIYAMNN